MFRDERLELKVGLFIGIGIFLMFFIVFSIKDVTMLGKGYDVVLVFDYVNGLSDNSPVRLAGVDVGQVSKVELKYDDGAESTRVWVTLRLKYGVEVEKDSTAGINTLGLLGEQYIEITPGKSEELLKDGDMVLGHNPLHVGRQMEKMNELVSSIANIAKHVEEGKGTVGKLLMDDSVYNNLEEFTADIKAHPWKLLSKPRGSRSGSSDDDSDDSGDDTSRGRGTVISPR